MLAGRDTDPWVNPSVAAEVEGGLFELSAGALESAAGVVLVLALRKEEEAGVGGVLMAKVKLAVPPLGAICGCSTLLMRRTGAPSPGA